MDGEQEGARASDLPTELTARVPQLLEAMRSVGTGLQLHSTLDRICETAAALTDARYAAIGVVAEDGDGLSDFVHHGVDAATARLIGRLPDGQRGLLGALIKHSEPVLLADLSADPRSCGFPPHHPPMRSFLGVPIRVQGEIFGNLYLSEKRGGARFDDDDLSMVRVLATEAGIAIGNARLYEAAQQRERWIDGAVAVTTALLSGGDAEDALQVVAEQVRHLSDSTAGLVLLPADEGGLEIVAVSSERPTGALGVVVAPESEITTRLLAGEAVFLEDAANDPRVLSELARHYGPAMLLPLRSEGRVLGTLVTLRGRGARTFTEGERTLAAQFAAQAALALKMAEAQRDRERLAVYEDRDRIARDLHDLVIQRLFATGMMLESAQRKSVVPRCGRGGQGRRRARRDHPGDPDRDLRPSAGARRGTVRPAHPGAPGDQHRRRTAGVQALAPLRRRRGRAGRGTHRQESHRRAAGGAVERVPARGRRPYRCRRRRDGHPARRRPRGTAHGRRRRGRHPRGRPAAAG